MNRNQLKYIAVLTMLVDHTGMFFVPITTLPGVLMRVIGRLTAPMMCYFLAEGFMQTSSRKKYGLRLLIFGLISQVPYALSHYGTVLKPDFNMILLLFLSFLMLEAEVRLREHPWRIPVLLVLLFFSGWCDWGIVGPLYVYAFYLYRGNRDMQVKCYAVLTGVMILADTLFLISNGAHWYGELWQAGLFLFIPLLYLYNGERGSRKAFHKWFFYAVYPLHLLIFYFINVMNGKY